MPALLRLVASLVVAVALLAALRAAPAESARCSGRAIVERGGVITLRADRLSTYGGMTCLTARGTVRRFLRRQLASFHRCAVPAANGGTCRVGAYDCEKVGRASCRHRDLDRGVRFRERDSTAG